MRKDNSINLLTNRVDSLILVSWKKNQTGKRIPLINVKAH